MKIVWYAEAVQDLSEFREYIRRDNPRAAQSVAQRFLKIVALLTDQPSLGKPGRVEGTRELAVPGLLFTIPYSESFPEGKVAFLNLRVMNFEEFLLALEEVPLVDLIRNHGFDHPVPEAAHLRLWELWKQYLVVRELPEAVQIFSRGKSNLYEASSSVRTVQKNLLEAHLADLAKHSGK
jgi:toxin ParE1/3/4